MENSSPKRILIVEDEAAIADSIAYALRTDGFAPDHVTLAGEALQRLKTAGHDYALAIFDVGLPDLNGFDLCRQVRQFSDIPVIFLTARSDEIDRVVGLEIGADDYVTKPFSPRELAARVRVILRRGAPRAAEAHAPAAATFEVRATEGRILFAGRPLDLTRYEFLLLRTLAERPGQIFSRAQLMDLVWTDAPDTLDRTVDTHIKSLRAKLKEIDITADPIHTHRGMGYSVSP
ncbi:two-component system response regulator CreB [Massilia arenosa]|uniref:Two-component system response regulator CreB n=1 Tax=Zemynaea arenosa TaxID=2561931 RepID=A0A4Y9S5C2_9BURK|nr:two-component system response regulator CreB [Massilia arenosa]TFW16540.1 two-component system response regulator CreB [Massilia arenosa]